MRYNVFELLMISVGGGAIVATVLFSLQGPVPPDAYEVIAQFMLLAVLVVAVHWGRRAGSWAAIVASLGYLVLRTPLLVSVQTNVFAAAPLLLTRIATFGIVGIVGGEVCSRIKYVFARLESDTSIDDWTRVYNQRQIWRALDAAHGQHVRYGAPFTAVLISITPSMITGLRASKQRSVLRAVADHMRNDVRLVDEVGRLDDGRFMLVLPQTPKDGGQIAAERVRKGVCSVLGAKEESVAIEICGAPEDIQRLDELRRDLQPEEDPAQLVPSGT